MSIVQDPVKLRRQALAADPAAIGTALSIARRYGRRYPPLADEFESAAGVAICEAADSFDPGRRVDFATHLTNRVVGAMKDTCREWTPKGFRRKRGAPTIVSLDVPRFADEGGNPLSLADVTPDGGGPVGWEAEAAEEVERLARGLPRRYGELVRRYYLDAGTTTLRQAGAAMGVSLSRAQQVHTKALAMLGESYPDCQARDVTPYSC